MKKSAILFPIMLGLTTWLLFYSTVEAANKVLNPGFEASDAERSAEI